MAQPRFITIHGHFYQPPRENPWLEAVETQDSAFPWHDWNERITAECYEPNATARILDDRDRIRRIANNYASISFNFGPTLMSWLETAAPETYAAILEADRTSAERFSGHGCAIAQAYNHIILPLAPLRDKRTQIRWGVADFEHRFGREPEGMWLPETAVDTETLECLVDEGIAFTILEPHQAARFRKKGAGEWHPAHGHIDPTMGYTCPLPSGRTIDIFFYDGPISRAVAFEQLLVRGENLAMRLVGAFSDARTHPQLVNIATDGETYGHHHRFGEMALAYALHFIESDGLARLTNYAEHRITHPPTHEVEIVERTAWSCSHGVERWRSDCGCHTGAAPGWNQQWRAPLRNALDWLSGELASLFEREGARLLRDAWTARDAYIGVILDRSEDNVQAFLDQHALPDAIPTAALELLEMQRNAMLMFTSCGWFFNDVSGIETVQVLQYAGRAIQLAERFGASAIEHTFVTKLEPARSNIPERGNGRQIYEREILGAKIDLARVAAHYAALSLFDSFDDDAPVYCYRVIRRHFELHKAGRTRLATGIIEVQSTITWETAVFDLATLHLGETELTGGIRVHTPDYEQLRTQLAAAMEPGGIPSVIRLLDVHFGTYPVSIRSLFRDEQRRVMHELVQATLEEAESAFRQLHERYDPLMRFHTRLGIPVPPVLHTVAEFDLNRQIRRLLEQDFPPAVEIASRLREASDENVKLDETTLMAFRDAVERVASLFSEHPEDLDRLESFESLVTVIRQAPLAIDLRRAQDRYYQMRKAVRPAIQAASSAGHAGKRWLELFDSLGDKLSINGSAG